MNKRDEILTHLLSECIEKKVLPSPFELAGISFSIAVTLMKGQLEQIDKDRLANNDLTDDEKNAILAVILCLQDFLTEITKEESLIHGAS